MLIASENIIFVQFKNHLINNLFITKGRGTLKMESSGSHYPDQVFLPHGTAWQASWYDALRKVWHLSSLAQKCLTVKVARSCPTLCDPMDYTVHGILQAGILEWIAYPFLQWIFPTQELNWEPIPSPDDLHHPGIEPGSPALQVILYQPSYQRRYDT